MSRTKKIFHLTFATDFCSVTFGSEIEEVNAKGDELYEKVRLSTLRDIKNTLKKDKVVRAIVENAKDRLTSSSAEDDAAELLKNL